MRHELVACLRVSCSPLAEQNGDVASVTLHGPESSPMRRVAAPKLSIAKPRSLAGSRPSFAKQNPEDLAGFANGTAPLKNQLRSGPADPQPNPWPGADVSDRPTSPVFHHLRWRAAPWALPYGRGSVTAYQIRCFRAARVSTRIREYCKSLSSRAVSLEA